MQMLRALSCLWALVGSNTFLLWLMRGPVLHGHSRPGSGPSKERVFLREPGSGAVKQYRHVLVPPALVQKHAIRMYMSDVMKRPEWGPMYVSSEYEEPGTSFAVHERDVNE